MQCKVGQISTALYLFLSRQKLECPCTSFKALLKELIGECLKRWNLKDYFMIFQFCYGFFPLISLHNEV